MSPTVSRSAESAATDVSIDIEAIVRRVLMQLRQEPASSEQNSVSEQAVTTSLRFDGGVFSLNDVKAVDASLEHLELSTRSVITPAARDELRRRGVVITKPSVNASMGSETTMPRAGTRAIHLQRDGDVSDPLFAGLKKQLRSRGVRLCNESSLDVVVSSRPATSAHQRTGTNRCVVSINRIDDVPRFMAELSPNTFVLDVAHMHLVALANAIALIAKPTSPSKLAPPKVTVAGGLS